MRVSSKCYSSILIGSMLALPAIGQQTNANQQSTGGTQVVRTMDDLRERILLDRIEQLEKRLADLEIQAQQQRALANRSRTLEQLLELRDRLTLTTVAAEVIASGPTPDFRTITIDKGSLQGFRPDLAVVAPAGVVGRIVVPSARASKVQLLIDRNAAAGALIERSRAQGVVVGGGEERLHLEFVSETSDVVVGDVVVTSGIDGIYPKGFVIGRVEAVEKSSGAYKQIIVRPAVDFASIEEVLVVTTPTPAREAALEGAR